jgi:hypothetical protein
MASLHHQGRSSSSSRRRLHSPLLLAISLISITTLCPQHPFQVAAQANKFASRPKLVDNASKKKKNKKVNTEDGTYLSPWRFGRKEPKVEEIVLDSSDWRRDLFAAEFQLILLSVMSSSLIAVLSWIWYRTTSKLVNDAKVVKPGETGGEYTCSLSLPPILLFIEFCNVFTHLVMHISSNISLCYIQNYSGGHHL